MTQFRVIAAVAITGMVATVPVAAQGKSGTRAGATTTTAHGRPSTGPGSATTAHGKSSTTTQGKSSTTTHGKSGTEHGKPSTTTATTTTTTTNTTTTTATPNALSTKLSSNLNQLARITAMLPAGMTLEAATAGFRNQGQFIAALNASKNQGVAFADLQKAMTVDGLSLGQAVRQLQNAPATGTTTPPPTSTTSTPPATTTTTSSAS
jgi:hypothetical protein